MAKGSRKPTAPLTPEDFYLDPHKLDEGVKLPLRGPDGRLTAEWLRVRSVHADSYQSAVSAALKAAYTENPDAELPLTEREIVKAYRHLLVTGWSFASEFAPDAARSLLDHNPSIAAAVVEVATRSSLFFPDIGEPSSPGPSES